MKTNRFFNMMMVCAALAFSACSSDSILDDNGTVSPETGQEGEVLFTGTVSDAFEVIPTEDLDGEATDGTRSTLITDNSQFLLNWETSDKISISNGTLNYTFQPQAEGSSCTFVSKSDATFLTDGTGSEGTFNAFYPADAVLVWNGDEVTTMIYTEQDYAENAASSGVMGPYMAARATTTDGGSKAGFTFGHVCSVIDVNFSGITDETVDAVSIYANSQASIAGKMKYNADTKAATVFTNDATDYSYSTQSEMIRVSNIPSGATYARFYVLPVKQENGFTITVHTTAGNYYTKKSTTAVGNSDANTNYLASISGVTDGNPVCLPYYKKYNFGSKTATNVRNMNWMAMIPGNVKFNHLSLPGAHDAASVGCTQQTSYTRCQSMNVENLLNNGCRALDLRPYYDSSNLTIYHGSYSANTTLASVLDNVINFLDNNPTETVFVLIAQEGGDDGNANWENRVWSCLSGYRDKNGKNYIADYGWNGNLNPCRGKMVVIFRNTYTNDTNTGDLGCGKVGWGSSFNPKTIMTGSKNGTNSGYTLYYQDEYEYTSNSYVSEKRVHLEDMLTNYIAKNETNANYIYVNNTNCIKGSSVLGNVVINTNLTESAQAVNEAVLGSTTFTNHTGRFGIMMTDFLFSSTQKGDQMFDLIHKQNYKYVYKNRTRCTSSANTGVDIATGEEATDGTVYSRKN